MGGKNQAKLTDKGVENAYVYRDRVLRTERFKLYVDTKGEPVTLIDLNKDPAEKTNILDRKDPEAQAALKLLTAPLKDFPEKDNDPHLHAASEATLGRQDQRQVESA